MLADITTLDHYMSEYGVLLGKQAAENTAPLHTPETDPVIDTDDLLREPFDAQSHVMTAGVKALHRQKTVVLVAEMGTGKNVDGCCDCP